MGSGSALEACSRRCAAQIHIYYFYNDLLPDLQSAYRAMHSTETAVLKVLADILLALDSGDLAMLTLLDLSAEFRQRRPRHATEPPAKVLRSWRTGAELVRPIFVWPYSTHTHIGGLFYTVSGSVRSTAGIGPRTNPIPSVHR